LSPAAIGIKIFFQVAQGIERGGGCGVFLKMPLIILAMISVLFSCNQWIPMEVKQILYGLSLSIKAVLLTILPLMVFMLLFKTIVRLSRGATKLVLVILVGICCSSFCGLLCSYPIGSLLYHLSPSLSIPQAHEGLTPTWVFSLPRWVSNDVALLAGLVVGICCAILVPRLAARLAGGFEMVMKHLFRGFPFVIPVFLAGFIIQMVHDQIFESIVRQFAHVFLVIAGSLLVYLCVLYFIANGFRVKPAFVQLKTMLPAVLTGFSTMSSAAAMPFTLLCAEKNLAHRPELPRLVIPLTVNIHLIGDSFATPILAFAVLNSFGMADPSFIHYVLFMCYFVLAKFSVASVPGGGILVMIPVLEQILGFSSEMSALISALYILFDPVITGANVCGNGAFTLLLDRFLTWRSKIGSGWVHVNQKSDVLRQQGS
jgi:Na+/H+-dicarboxylate symporter